MSQHRGTWATFAMALWLLSASPVTAQAQTAGQAAPQAAGGDQTVTVELNKLQPIDNACRVYLLLENPGTTAFETLNVELVSLDKEGIIGQWLNVELAPLPAGKTRVKPFDMAGVDCQSIDRLLLNDVLACKSGGAEIEGCIDRLKPRSRSSVTFWK